jgi:signal transduction histidine kinase
VATNPQASERDETPLRLWAHFAPLRENFEPVHVAQAATPEERLNPFAGLDAGPWITWGAIVGCWALIALMSVSQSYLLFTDVGRTVSLADIALWSVTEVITWAALSPIILWLARRYRISRAAWRRGLAVQGLSGVGFAVVQPAVQIAAGFFLFGASASGASFAELYRFSVVRKFHIDLLLYWMIVGLSHGIAYYRRYRDRELRASQLEARLAESQLEALRMQLRPHFLFNTLNSISALIDEDPRAASRMVARVGEFLRLTLETSGAQLATFEDELRFLRTYLEIEAIRFEDRLAVRYDVDPETLAARVPSMLMQPVVENAIKHGISKRDDDGRIEIRARTDAGRLRIDVRDNGPGLEETDRSADRGLGLANTRARLGNLYESGYSFELANDPDGGTVVRIDLPFTTSADDRDAATEDDRGRR